MTPEFRVRPAQPADAKAMARIHVQSWKQTYRGNLMSDAVLDDRELLPSREQFWTGALTDERWASNRIAVAQQNGSLMGIAMSGPSARGARSQHLHVLYLLNKHHGSGAGTALLNAVLNANDRATLWVGDPNPRAQAFYRRNGFCPDSTVRVDSGVREIHMIRSARQDHV